MKEKSSTTYWRLLVSFPFALLALYYVVGGAWYALAVMASHKAPSGDKVLASGSSAEARAAGTLLDTVLVSPRTARYGAYTVEFTDGWVERLRVSHRPAWYARRTIRPTDAVCLHLRYRVRQHGPPVTDPWTAPVFTCAQSGVEGARYPIVEERPLQVYAELSATGFYYMELPIELRLENGQDDSVARFVACPAQRLYLLAPPARR